MRSAEQQNSRETGGQSAILSLSDADRIAISKTRHCFLHPLDPGKVIKIVVRAPRYSFQDNANIKEWKYYQRLRNMNVPIDFIPEYFGFVETNLGVGLVSECIRDFDGKISVRLQQVVNHEVAYDLREVERTIRLLTQRLVMHNIQLFDLNRFNLLIQRQKDGTYRPVTIDVKGPYNNNEFIPFSNYIKYFSISKLRRRCARLLNIITTAQGESDKSGRGG